MPEPDDADEKIPDVDDTEQEHEVDDDAEVVVEQVHKFDDELDADDDLEDDVKPKEEADVGDNPPSHDDNVSPDPPAAARAPQAQKSDADSSSQRPAPVEEDYTARFERIVSETGAPAREAKAWLSRVLTDGPRAVADILMVVVSPAVSPEADTDMKYCPITQETVMRNQPVESVKDVCEHLRLGGDYLPGMNTLVSSKVARRAYTDFWCRVASEANDSVLYDTDCFDTLLAWLEAMATAPVSILRHAAAIAAYALVDGLIATGAKLKKLLKDRQRQLETEKTRCEKRAKKGNPPNYSKRYKALHDEVAHMSANSGELVELADKVFTGLFVLKYRDVTPEIRGASVECLGRWIMAQSDHYLDDTHLKYVGWLLSDKEVSVRRVAVGVLLDLLREPHFFSSLDLFLRRFITRIVEMTADKDNDVACKALKACTLLVQHKGVIEREAADGLCDLMFEETSVNVRKAAGEFVAVLIAGADDDAPKTSKKRRRKLDIYSEEIPTVDRAKVLLASLMDVCVTDENDVPNANTIIEAMWDVFPALRSWEAYAFLLEQDDDSEETLSEAAKALLCELLVGAAGIVVEEEPKSQSKGSSRRRSTTPIVETCSDKLARIFTALIPKLLVQYQGSARILAALIRIPNYFSNLHFQETASKQHFIELLHGLVGAISRHTGSVKVLEATSVTFRAMTAEMHPLCELAKEALGKAAIDTAKELHVLVASGIEGSDEVKVEASILKAKVIGELMELPDGTVDDVLAVLDAVLEKELPVRFNTTVANDALAVATNQYNWDAIRAQQLLGGKQVIDTGREDDFDDEEALKERKEIEEKLKSTFRDMLKRSLPLLEYPFNLRVRVKTAIAVFNLLLVRSGIKKYIKLDLDDTPPEDAEHQVPLSEMCCAAVKECVIDLMHQRLTMPSRHSRVSLRFDNLRGKDAHVAESDVYNFSKAIVQVSIQAAIPERFRFLPFFAFLFNRDGVLDLMNLSKMYLMKKMEAPSDGHELARDALFAAADIKGGGRDPKHFAVSLLSRAIVELSPIQKESPFFANLLGALVSESQLSMGDEKSIRKSISILGKCNAFFAPYVPHERSKEIGDEMRLLSSKLRDREDLDRNVRDELSQLVRPIIQQLEAITSGEEPRRPGKPRKPPRPASRGGKAKRGRRRSEYVPSMPVNTESQSLRRSSRRRKPRQMPTYDMAVEQDVDEDLDDAEVDKQEDDIDDVGNAMDFEVPKEGDVEKDEEDAEDGEEEGDDEEEDDDVEEKNAGKVDEEEDVGQTSPDAKMANGEENDEPKKLRRSKRRSSKTSVPTDESVDEVGDEELPEEEEDEPKKQRKSRRRSSKTSVPVDENVDEAEDEELPEEEVDEPKNRRKSMRSSSKTDVPMDEGSDKVDDEELREQDEDEDEPKKRRKSKRRSAKKAADMDDNTEKAEDMELRDEEDDEHEEEDGNTDVVKDNHELVEPSDEEDEAAEPADDDGEDAEPADDDGEDAEPADAESEDDEDSEVKAEDDGQDPKVDSQSDGVTESVADVEVTPSKKGRTTSSKRRRSTIEDADAIAVAAAVQEDEPETVENRPVDVRTKRTQNGTPNGGGSRKRSGGENTAVIRRKKIRKY